MKLSKNLAIFKAIAGIAFIGGTMTVGFSVAPANAQRVCQCTDYVANRNNLTRDYPNAADWNNGYLQKNGFRQVGPQPGAILEILHMLRYCFGLTFIIHFLILSFYGQISWADTTASESTNGTVDVSQLSDPTLETSTSGASNLPSQSASIYQNYGYGSNPLNYPNCGGFCAFGVVRLTPNNNGNINPKAIMGVVMQFDSPEKRLATGEQYYNQARSDRMAQEDEVSLLTKLADAVEQCKDAHANLLALAAAKRLGMTPEELLARAYKQPRQCNSHSGN